jgi:DNA-binding NarL/FixJ family response regulator
MRGEKVLQKLRANPETAFLPVAVLGDVFYDEEVQCAYQRGANAYLVKPVKFEDYKTTLRDTLKFWGRNYLSRPCWRANGLMGSCNR